MSFLPIDILKAQAKSLRVEDGALSHSASLELLAKQRGLPDWNTLSAKAKRDAPFRVGMNTSGRYLGILFGGKILAVTETSAGRYRLKLHFHEPVDVITFEGLSNFRQRVNVTVNHFGTTEEKTSNGQPHLQITSIEGTAR